MSNIVHFIHGGGFVMYPLLILSLTAIVVIVERAIAFHQYGQAPGSLIKDVIADVRNDQFGSAVERCEHQSGPLSACLLVVLRHHVHIHTMNEIERLVEETGEEYFIRLERFLPILDTTTTISPLLGLLGTIVGMIGAFNAIAIQSHHGNNDAVLAGVGEALYATATGLIIAVVCFAAYNYFTARLRYLSAETEQAATKLINVLYEKKRNANHTELKEAQEADRGVQTSSRA
jgi:biopolymer transport protein ExbB